MILSWLDFYSIFNNSIYFAYNLVYYSNILTYLDLRYLITFYILIINLYFKLANHLFIKKNHNTIYIFYYIYLKNNTI